MDIREAVFSKDLANKTLTITRSFGASLDRVWEAWTTSAILDEWWGPKPYKVETKTMEFKEGGIWLYCMVGPTGDKHWCIEKYNHIYPKRTINNHCAFCDEDGNEDNAFPMYNWNKAFTAAGDETQVNIDITFSSDEDMETLIKMGFEQGFKMGLGNLDEYLAAL